jgi:hypothetical protein
MNENRYSYLVGSYRPPQSRDYEVESPEGSFELTVQSLYIAGQGQLHHGEYNLALHAFQELQALILRTVHPQMPVDPNWLRYFNFPFDAPVLDALSNRAVETLKSCPVVKYTFPNDMVSGQTMLPALVAAKLANIGNAGVQVTSFHAVAGQQIDAALAEAEKENWNGALKLYTGALAAVPANDALVKGSLLHDMALLAEKAGDKASAEQFATKSVAAINAAGRPEAQVRILDAATGVLQRIGKPDIAAKFSDQAGQIRSSNNINRVLNRPVQVFAALQTPVARLPAGIKIASPVRTAAAVAAAAEPAGALAAAEAAPPDASVAAPTLLGLTFVRPEAVTKTLTVQGAATAASVVLDSQAAANMQSFLKTISTTPDLGLLTRYFFDPVQMVAYMPHLYFFVLPMSVGDCLAGMGNLQETVDQYSSVLAYPFINQKYEVVKLWTRIAQALLDMGDDAYRQAKDAVPQFAAARAFYEKIVKSDKTLDAASILYQNAQFAGIKSRVAAFLAAADPAAFDENPAITLIVTQALNRLRQIQQGLNFFGFSASYAPPFSFEYLQDTARYFAQQASQIEQRYIQFQNQAENEELQRDQLSQQAEVARQSVVLEQRGVAEAQRGVAVAAASQRYANVQLANAQQAKNDFNNTRWELLELTEAEAWASASAVDHDDEVKLTWNGNYYSSSHKPRNQVLQDLAYKRGRLSQDLEAAKLNREIAAAQAYAGVAQAQAAEAQARLAVAQQRVMVAQIQQKYAEQNRDFLDMREFGSQLWYELAQQAKRLTQRYLDMATEIAFLMERAYNAETERGLQVIRYGYQHTSSGNLMGADLLLSDIDSFTFDHVTTTKNKKIPVKKTISLADSYPMQFQQLKAAGNCLFETTFEDFDREYPGLYLAKIRNVELIFVGIAGAASVAGTLRNIGVSRFRNSAGTVVTRLYPPDVMALSQYDIRQDALTFRFSPNDLRLFENNGIATLWQLDLPPAANDFDFGDILDVQMVLYYDGFFDPQLELAIRGALPTNGGASRAFSMKMSFPDELFFLKSQGEAQLDFTELLFPRNIKNLVRTKTTIKFTGQPSTVQNLNFELAAGAAGAAALVLTTDANGEAGDAAANSPLRPLRGKPMFDHWKISIKAAANRPLVHNGALDLGGLDDVLIFSEYGFNYR